MSKQAYYKRDEEVIMRKIAQEDFAVNFVKDIRKKDPGIGGKKLWHMYRKNFTGNFPLGRDSFESILDKYDLKIRHRMRKPRTTDSTHGLPLYPNLIKEFIPDAPNRLWVSDITYIPIWIDDEHYVFCYLSMVLDAYTEEIVGWSVGMSLDTTYPLQALEMALRRLDGVECVNLIHHSDRGCQYASARYVALLKSYGIRISMTESGNPKDNPQAERINNTMKNELLKGKRFTSIEEVIAAVEIAVAFYNEERPHMSIGMMTPKEAASHTGEMHRLWLSYREEYIRRNRNAAVIEKESPTMPAMATQQSHMQPMI